MLIFLMMWPTWNASPKRRHLYDRRINIRRVATDSL